jgi:hypothetical protein
LNARSDLWTAASVWTREVDAMRTLSRLPLERAKSLGSNWPAIRRTFADAVNAEEMRDRKQFPQGWSRPGPPQPRAIDEMLEVWAWHARFLSDHTELVRIIQGMALAVARGRPELAGVAYLKRRRWTAYRAKERGLARIATGLNADFGAKIHMPQSHS